MLGRDQHNQPGNNARRAVVIAADGDAVEMRPCRNGGQFGVTSVQADDEVACGIPFDGKPFVRRMLGDDLHRFGFRLAIGFPRNPDAIEGCRAQGCEQIDGKSPQSFRHGGCFASTGNPVCNRIRHKRLQK